MANSSPLVSLIMPIYKVRDYISFSIESVINQTYDNIELILVDDGTPDDSAEIAEKLLKEKNYEYKIIHQENQGMGYARNSGLNAATGEWIFFLDSDDVILPVTVERMVAAADSDVDFVFSSFRLIYDYAERSDVPAPTKPRFISGAEVRENFLLRKMIVLAPGTLFRKSFLLKNNLTYEKFLWSEDQHFVWRALFKAEKAAFIDEPLYQYYRRGMSVMTSTSLKTIADSYPYIRDMVADFDTDGEMKDFILARWVLGSLNASSKLGDYKGWKSLFEILESPRHIKVLRKFPDKKVRLLAVVASVSPKLLYTVCKSR